MFGIIYAPALSLLYATLDPEHAMEAKIAPDDTATLDKRELRPLHGARSGPKGARRLRQPLARRREHRRIPEAVAHRGKAQGELVAEVLPHRARRSRSLRAARRDERVGHGRRAGHSERRRRQRHHARRQAAGVREGANAVRQPASSSPGRASHCRSARKSLQNRRNRATRIADRPHFRNTLRRRIIELEASRGPNAGAAATDGSCHGAARRGTPVCLVVSALSALAVAGLPSSVACAPPRMPTVPPQSGYDPYAPPRDGASEQDQAPPPDAQPPYRPGGVYREDDNYRRYEDRARGRRPRDDEPGPGYGEPYHAPGDTTASAARWPRPAAALRSVIRRTRSSSAGRRFFGSVSKGLASVVEYAFQKSGRPNGYILGEDAGGAFVAGLRYGEGTLYTKDAGVHKVFWQGPSIGYDFGGEGSKTMVLVYNLRDPSRDLRALCGRSGLGLYRRRRRHPVPDARQRDAGAHPFGDRAAARCERRIFEVYPRADVESVLSRRAAGDEARSERSAVSALRKSSLVG